MNYTLPVVAASSFLFVATLNRFATSLPLLLDNLFFRSLISALYEAIWSLKYSSGWFSISSFRTKSYGYSFTNVGVAVHVEFQIEFFYRRSQRSLLHLLVLILLHHPVEWIFPYLCPWVVLLQGVARLLGIPGSDTW